MRKGSLLLVLLLAFVSLNAQNNKMKIAVMDFKAGVGVNQAEIEGLSDMLINTLFQTGKFEIIERTQIDQARKELKFQETEPTYEQIAQMGRFLGVESVLIGTVNKLFDEYNVDVRAINVESAKVVTTAGRSLDKKTASAFRKMMEKLGKELAKNLIEEKPVIKEVGEKKVETKPETFHFRKPGFTLRPEVGMTIPLASDLSSYYYSDLLSSSNYYVYSEMTGYGYFPSIELAVGYQFSPHIFLGIIGGYGGQIKGYYEDYCNSNGFVEVPYSSSLYPIMVDLRWYLLDHKYSFVFDSRLGMAICNYYQDNDLTVFGGGAEKLSSLLLYYNVNFGFAIKDFEATIGYKGGWDEGVFGRVHGLIHGLTLNLSYRFGNVIKKWW